MILGALTRIVGFLAILATVGQMCTGVFMCRVIVKKGSTRNIPSMPFIGGLVISILSLQQARFIGDGGMNFVNIFGVLINLGYLAFYYLYSKKKVQEEFVKNLAKALLFTGLLLIYANVEDPVKVEQRFGIVVSSVILAFIASPLIELPQILEKKSTKGLPYPMIITGFVVSFMWFLYSLLIWNKILIIQNFLALVICGFQLYLFEIFPDTPIKSTIKFE